ncbi:MAG: RHS repeat protein [Synechococcaceae cyanobacterium SM2_3_1]|nr:RHS repeat protein [Synechococcaceae cyanobacterium SM2_3_1]
MVETIYPDTERVLMTYTPTGQIETMTDQANKLTRFEYNERDRLTAVVDALDQRIEYGYDATNNLTKILDANLHLTQHEYDARNRRNKTTLPLNQMMTMTYDKVGNPKTMTDSMVMSSPMTMIH